MTSLQECAPAFSRRDASEVWPNFCPSDNRGRRESRVPDAPAASRAKLSEAHERSHRGFAGTPGLPCAMVLTVSFVLSPVIGLVCHRRLRIGGKFGPVGPALASANLTPASGRQDHTTSPSATCAVRLRAGRPLTSPIRTRPATPFARRSRPSGGETAGLIELILAAMKAEYFSNQGWTGFADLPDRQFARKGRWPPLVVYLHPQSPAIDFVAAKTRVAVASSNSARTGEALKDCIVVVSSGLTVSELVREPTN